MHPSEPTLNEYVDRTLGRDERAQVARHLEACDMCRQVVADIQEITRAAAALEGVAPPARVWARIANELRNNSPQRGARRSFPQSWTWLAAAQAIEAELQLAEDHYRKAISGLERIASTENAAFDAETAATLQKNLAVINQAIDESQAAVRSDPVSRQAQYSLIENFKTKLALLQDTVALINELRAGNKAAAGRIVSGS